MVFAGKPIKLILSTAGTGEIWENLEAIEKTSYELKIFVYVLELSEAI